MECIETLSDIMQCKVKLNLFAPPLIEVLQSSFERFESSISKLLLQMERFCNSVNGMLSSSEEIRNELSKLYKEEESILGDVLLRTLKTIDSSLVTTLQPLLDTLSETRESCTQKYVKRLNSIRSRILYLQKLKEEFVQNQGAWHKMRDKHNRRSISPEIQEILRKKHEKLLTSESAFYEAKSTIIDEVGALTEQHYNDLDPLLLRFTSVKMAMDIAMDEDTKTDIVQECLSRLKTAQENTTEEQTFSSLQSLINHPVGIRYFTSYLKQERSEENITFYTDVQHFKSLSDKQEIVTQAQEIYSKYLSPSALHQINVSGKNKLAVTQAMQNTDTIDSSLFNNCQKEIFELMKTDTFERFSKSDYYKRMILRLTKRISTTPDNHSQRRFARSVSFSALQKALDEKPRESEIFRTASLNPKAIKKIFQSRHSSTPTSSVSLPNVSLTRERSVTMEHVQMSLAKSQGVTPSPKKSRSKNDSRKSHSASSSSSTALAEKTKQAIDAAVQSLLDEDGRVKVPSTPSSRASTPSSTPYLTPSISPSPSTLSIPESAATYPSLPPSPAPSPAPLTPSLSSSSASLATTSTATTTTATATTTFTAQTPSQPSQQASQPLSQQPSQTPSQSTSQLSSQSSSQQPQSSSQLSSQPQSSSKSQSSAATAAPPPLPRRTPSTKELTAAVKSNSATATNTTATKTAAVHSAAANTTAADSTQKSNTAATPSQQQKQAKVLWNFVAAESNELSLKIGDIVNILDDSDDGWWFGELVASQQKGSGTAAQQQKGEVEGGTAVAKKGFFPKNYVQCIAIDSSSAAGTKKAQVLFDYDKRGDDEISLKSGETVTVYSTSNAEDWWQGEKQNGEIGFFPRVYVKVLVNSNNKTLNNK